MKFYVTFGTAHTHKVEDKVFDSNCVAVIDADSYAEGRGDAFNFFGPKFAFIYDEEDFDHGWMDRYYPRGFVEVPKC